MKKSRTGIYVMMYLFLLLVFSQYEEKGITQTTGAETENEKKIEKQTGEILQEEEMKKVAITFDDGPSVYTERLLEGLKERNVCATFFVVGERAEEYPKLLKQMKEQGNLIGNHTYSHTQLNAVDCEIALAEVKKTNDIIQEQTGVSCEYLRPPYGECCSAVKEQLDMVTVLWDVDPLDWCTDDAKTVATRILEKTGENDIILLHDCYESSVQAAFLVIDALKEKGYEFVTVDELLFP